MVPREALAIMLVVAASAGALWSSRPTAPPPIEP
jgi:threonine/homoserine efflux transporter RhtA